MSWRLRSKKKTNKKQWCFHSTSIHQLQVYVEILNRETSMNEWTCAVKAFQQRHIHKSLDLGFWVLTQAKNESCQSHCHFPTMPQKSWYKALALFNQPVLPSRCTTHYLSICNFKIQRVASTHVTVKRGFFGTQLSHWLHHLNTFWFLTKLLGRFRNKFFFEPQTTKGPFQFNNLASSIILMSFRQGG